MQCRLCASCWIYWKKYGGLKTPTQLEGVTRSASVSPQTPKFHLGTSQNPLGHPRFHLRTSQNSLGCSSPHLGPSSFPQDAPNPPLELPKAP